MKKILMISGLLVLSGAGFADSAFQNGIQVHVVNNTTHACTTDPTKHLSGCLSGLKTQVVTVGDSPIYLPMTTHELIYTKSTYEGYNPDQLEGKSFVIQAAIMDKSGKFYPDAQGCKFVITPNAGPTSWLPETKTITFTEISEGSYHCDISG